MNIYDLATDTKKQNAGVWFEAKSLSDFVRVDEPTGEGIFFKIACTKTSEYARAFTNALQPYKRQYRNKSLPDEIAINIANSLLSTHVIKDWYGVKDDSGKAIEYTPESGANLLGKPEFKQLSDKLYELASDVENFTLTTEEDLEADKENLS